MGDNSDDTWDDIRRHREAIKALGEAVPGSVFESMANDMRATSLPEDLRNAPLIIDTDIGGDADDALAVAAAARYTTDLKLVITADESQGRRARFARRLLDLMGRSDVTTVAGAELSDTPYFVIEDLVPQDVPPQRTDVVAAVREVLAAIDGPVRWVGMGPLSNLAHVLAEAPEAAERLRVTQMGGALRYRNPESAEHNIRLDVPAAHSVLAAVTDGRLRKPEFIASEVTFTPRIEITAESPLYAWLAAPDAPQWARLLTAHLDAWFTRFHPGTMQHDALTLTAALRLPFVESSTLRIAMDDIGRTTEADDGARLRWSFDADYDAFMTWLTETLTGQTPPATTHPEGGRS